MAMRGVRVPVAVVVMPVLRLVCDRLCHKNQIDDRARRSLTAKRMP
jgi:hypothetical protein